MDTGAPVTGGVGERQQWWRVLGWGSLAFVLLTLQFSPNWFTFWQELRDVKSNASNPAEIAAIDRALFSGYSARGFFVTQQARDLTTTIDDVNHQIVRWRLLFPVLGYVLHLPGWVVLGLAHLGCAVLILTWTAVALRLAPPAPGRAMEAGCMAVVAGAAAPFFSSMGLLGYYDSWLALALLIVAVADSRWSVFVAAVLAPWIDERFVIGLPLALGARFLFATPPPGLGGAWVKQQALAPVGAVIAFSFLRLHLGGSGGSQTVGQYLNDFVFSEQLTWLERMRGALEGLRFGWILVAVAAVTLWFRPGHRARLEALALTIGVCLTALLGLLTALDLGRSMVLLTPVVPLGWFFASRQLTSRTRYFAPILAIGALLAPANHIVGQFARPVDKFWQPPLALIVSENNLGALFASGIGVPVDLGRALALYRKAAEYGNGVAQFNLGAIYESGPYRNPAEALKWYQMAADQGVASAYFNLGLLYAKGVDVPRDFVVAHRWLAAATASGFANAPEALAQVERLMKPAELAAAKAAGPAVAEKSAPR